MIEAHQQTDVDDGKRVGLIFVGCGAVVWGHDDGKSRMDSKNHMITQSCLEIHIWLAMETSTVLLGKVILEFHSSG